MTIDWRPDELNETLRAIAESCGVPVARAIFEQFSGMRVFVPKTLGEQNALRVIGDAAAETFSQIFGGEHVVIPRSFATPAARVARARILREAGASINEIARALDLSHRSAQEHVAGTVSLVQRGKRRVIDPRQVDIEDYLDKSA